MDAIFEHYDALLLKDPSKTADEISFLEREMDRQDCRFGEKIFPTFLKPMFLSAEQIREISGIIHHAMNILEKVTHLYFSNPQLREYFYINDRAHELIEIDQGYAKNIVIARPDSFLVGQAIRFIEVDGRIYTGPAAVFQAFHRYSRKWRWVMPLYRNIWIFRFLADHHYAFVSKNRTRMYGITIRLFGKNPARPRYYWAAYLGSIIAVGLAIWII